MLTHCVVVVVVRQVSGAGSAEDDSRLYTEAQLNSCMNKIETADFLQVRGPGVSCHCCCGICAHSHAGDYCRRWWWKGLSFSS